MQNISISPDPSFPSHICAYTWKGLGSRPQSHNSIHIMRQLCGHGLRSVEEVESAIVATLPKSSYPKQ